MLVPMAMVKSLDSRKPFKERFYTEECHDMIHVLKIPLAALLKMGYRSTGKARRSVKRLLELTRSETMVEELNMITRIG